jgi:hypothetical protein
MSTSDFYRQIRMQALLGSLLWLVPRGTVSEHTQNQDGKIDNPPIVNRADQEILPIACGRSSLAP